MFIVQEYCHSPGLTLELAELLGGPRGKSFGFGGFGSSSLGEQVINLRTNLHQLHHILTECCAQVTAHKHNVFKLTQSEGGGHQRRMESSYKKEEPIWWGAGGGGRGLLTGKSVWKKGINIQKGLM